NRHDDIAAWRVARCARTAFQWHSRATRMTHDDLELDLLHVGELVAETVRQREGERAFNLLSGLRGAAMSLRLNDLPRGRDAFATRIGSLALDELALVARSLALFFHLANLAEEQHRIRVLRMRDLPGQPPEGSIARACAQLRKGGIKADDVRGLLSRLLVM